MGDVLLQTIEYIKIQLAKRRPVQYVARPLLPRDIGKVNWVWNEGGNEVKVTDTSVILITGIWCKEFIEVLVVYGGISAVGGTRLAVLSPNVPLIENFPVFAPGESFDIRVDAYDLDGHTLKFALTGYAVEEMGINITDRSVGEVIKLK